MAYDGSPAEAEVRLQQIQAITDSALAHMDVDALLSELLDRVTEILDVDTAVVLLLDPPANQLVASAARGIEEEVVQRVRIPFGQGFAGRVAADRRPVIIDDVSAADLVNPLLRQRGIQSLLGVPLVAGGDLVGVLHVGVLHTRRFTDNEVELLQLAADRAAMAVSALQAQSERAAAREIQRSLVPGALPDISGVELAARYSPGKDNVGGDWYDVFTLPTGELGIAIGDVAGHGLEAAVVMGRMRSSLRAYALESTDPAEVLRRLDISMHYFEPEAMATVLYAVFDPTRQTARISSAGHWPPVLASPGRAPSLVEMTPDVLIGAGYGIPRHSIRVEIAPGAVMCFYTDGLIERRDGSTDANIATLCESIFLGPPSAISSVIIAALVGRRAMEDDVALLVFRREFIPS
jgi:phosphoserine phosphatase RsbU/P